MALLVNNLLANEGDAKDAGSIPGSEGSLGGGNDNPLQYSCLENPMDRGTWWATAHGVTKSQPLAHRRADIYLVLRAKYNRIKCNEIKTLLNEIE